MAAARTALDRRAEWAGPPEEPEEARQPLSEEDEFFLRVSRRGVDNPVVRAPCCGRKTQLDMLLDIRPGRSRGGNPNSEIAQQASRRGSTLGLLCTTCASRLKFQGKASWGQLMAAATP